MIVLLLLLLLACPSVANATVLIQSAAASTTTTSVDACAAAGCSGTYMFCWTGDYSGDTDKACTNSGAGTIDGTINNATVHSDYGESSNGVLIDADEDYINYTVTGDDIFSEAIGTLWARIKIIDDGTDSDIPVMEMGDVFANNNYVYMLLRSGRKIRGQWEGNNSIDLVDSSSAISENTWTTVGIAWTEGGNFAATHDGGTTWNDEADALDSWMVEPEDIYIGTTGAGVTINDALYIDRVIITGGYKDAKPTGW